MRLETTTNRPCDTIPAAPSLSFEFSPRGARPAAVHAAVARGSTEAVAETHPVEMTLVPPDLIGGGESIIFAIKPSPWFILFDSINWIVVTLVILAAAGWIAEIVSNISESRLMTSMLAIMGARIGVAMLRWVSRSYVLTNRRVMTIQGVFKSEVFECPLVNIRNTAITANFGESLTRLGTLHFVLAPEGDRRVAWANVTHPQEIHTEVRKAIRRALDCQPHL